MLGNRAGLLWPKKGAVGEVENTRSSGCVAMQVHSRAHWPIRGVVLCTEHFSSPGIAYCNTLHAKIKSVVAAKGESLVIWRLYPQSHGIHRHNNDLMAESQVVEDRQSYLSWITAGVGTVTVE